jgi:acyl-CoA dehydrogenase
LAVTVAPGRLDVANPFSIAATQVTASGDGDSFVLNGIVPQVIDLAVAGLALVPARLADGLALFALAPDAGYGVRKLTPLDATRQLGTLVLDAVKVNAGARVDADGLHAGTTDAALATALLGLAAEAVGAARGVMDLTLAYISERVQFGRRIASFQAVKHRCAMLEVDLAEARSLLYGAARTEDTGALLLEASGAQALASELAMRAAEEAIQLHGGVGFTWDYDPHFYFKRAQASRALLGGTEQLFERIARSLLDAEVRA